VFPDTSKDFSIGKLASRHRRFGRLSVLSLLSDLSLDVVNSFVERCASLRATLDRVDRRSTQVGRADFNSNIYEEMSAYRGDVRFSLPEIDFCFQYGPHHCVHP
jgi:hypothetical protein